ncbi:proline-rich protein HaeIII subfamily 1-like [Pan paniscus]|uniref:proline-rich protein HaeIII subfamily 1-like n=1 Tax=Pan paniscus TaxID=9597 RepID=UPI00155FE211
MNSLSGGASIPNATPSPNTPSTTNYQFSPPSPQAPPPPAAPGSLRLRAPREPPEWSPGKESATRSPGSRPALAPSWARDRPPAGRSGCGLGRRRPGCWPPRERGPADDRHPGFRRVSSPSPDLEPHPAVSELPPLAALSAPVFGPELSFIADTSFGADLSQRPDLIR